MWDFGDYDLLEKWANEEAGCGGIIFFFIWYFAFTPASFFALIIYRTFGKFRPEKKRENLLIGLIFFLWFVTIQVIDFYFYHGRAFTVYGKLFFDVKYFIMEWIY